jgi:hypothetical protein
MGTVGYDGGNEPMGWAVAPCDSAWFKQDFCFIFFFNLSVIYFYHKEVTFKVHLDE